jgi:hypothetical protein
LWLACQRGLGLGLSRSSIVLSEVGHYKRKWNATNTNTSGTTALHLAAVNVKLRMKLASSVPQGPKKPTRTETPSNNIVVDIVILWRSKNDLAHSETDRQGHEPRFDLGWLEALWGGLFSAHPSQT